MPDYGAENGLERNRLAELIGRYATRDGITRSPLEGVSFFRASRPRARAAVIYEPCIAIVGQGRKYVYLADRVYTYDAHNYLVLSVPLPAHSEIRAATPEAPFLSFTVALDTAVLRDLILEIDAEPRPEALQTGVCVSRLGEAFGEAALRLLQALADPMDCRVLGPLYVREIFYRALEGPQGGFLRAVAAHHSQFHRIARVLQLIHTRFDKPLDVASMAQAANMSTSTFHHTFKAVTSLPPLQYVKTTRLHQARALMLRENLSAGEAAYRVGYNSPSQFSREFKRLFGLPPTEERERLVASDEPISEVP